MLLRRVATVLLSSTLLLTACGGEDVPTKAEFMAAFKKSQDAQLSQLEDAGIDKAELDKVVDTWLGCTYDKIKDDEQLLRDAAGNDESSDAKSDTAVAQKIQDKAASCQNDAIKAITALGQANQGG